LLQLAENLKHFVTIGRKPKAFGCNWQKNLKNLVAIGRKPKAFGWNWQKT
jgi:hypothetical protein